MCKDQNVRRWKFSSLSRDEYLSLLKRTEADLSQYLEKVIPIIASVREHGDEAVCEFTAKFDGAKISPSGLLVSEQEFDLAEAQLSPSVKQAILHARDNILAYHRFQLPKPITMTPVSPGVLAGERYNAIPSVACYVPRGKGSFPSVCLMTAAPAVIAGVKKIIIITPPGADGSVDAGTLFAARSLGLSEVYKCGGAQGVAAVAFGTNAIPKCDKIVGPGSPWVVAAKQILSRQIDPGPPAGPSEAIVVADGTANSWKAALDLVNESEHGPDSSAFLVTNDAAIADQVEQYIPHIWRRLSDSRRAFSQAVLTGAKGGIILCDDVDQIAAFVNDYAPEHLQVHSIEPFSYIEKLANAGEILLGEHSAISLGNFILGPNAVLPTGGGARTASPLSVYDYLKRTSVVHVAKSGYKPLAASAEILARYEGFDAHALAVSEWRDNPPTLS